jgi:hypothetical protein
MTSPNRARPLQVEARLSSYQPLLSLSGRLDVVIAGARRAVGQGEGATGVGSAGPLVTFEVQSDGEVEVEDAFEAGSEDGGESRCGA